MYARFARLSQLFVRGFGLGFEPKLFHSSIATHTQTIKMFEFEFIS